MPEEEVPFCRLTSSPRFCCVSWAETRPSDAQFLVVDRGRMPGFEAWLSLSLSKFLKHFEPRCPHPSHGTEAACALAGSRPSYCLIVPTG